MLVRTSKFSKLFKQIEISLVLACLFSFRKCAFVFQVKRVGPAKTLADWWVQSVHGEYGKCLISCRSISAKSLGTYSQKSTSIARVNSIYRHFQHHWLPKISRCMRQIKRASNNYVEKAIKIALRDILLTTSNISVLSHEWIRCGDQICTQRLWANGVATSNEYV